MASIEEIKNERLRKLEILRENGMNPYPSDSKRTHDIRTVRESFSDLESSSSEVTLSGRVMALRGQGAVVFFNIFDGTDTFQGLLKKDDTPEEVRGLFLETVDIGDFVDITGALFVTQKGEQTLLVKKWRMLAKSLRPLPDKWHGLQDEDLRLRQRYLDLLFDSELRDLFVKRAKFWDVTRAFMKERGFLEVETPTLETTTGGAEARPFKTHHNDYDMDVYLRISVGELWQKRLMAAGFPKTFEIGRAYRNEGTSPEHLQEFTNMEFYWAYVNYEDGMKLVQELYRMIAQKVFGTTVFTYKEHQFDLADEWKKIDYREEVLRQTGIDVLDADEHAIKAKLEELGVAYEGDNKERLTDTLWKYCRKSISGPAFLIHNPKLVAPLSKTKTDNPELTEIFQPLIAGSEVGRGYSELNDPLDQRARFELQQKLIERGDEEAMMSDWDFVEMLEHGMPPACGFGFGERFFTILSGKTLREATLFPLVKPK